MADSFLRSPVQAAVSAEMERIEARRGARAAPPAPIDPRGMFEQASEQYQVPANLLMALGEASGLDPADFASKSGQLAEALGKSIGSGRKHSEAIREVLPGAPAGFEKQIVDRSNALYDEIYAARDDGPASGPTPEQPSSLSVGGVIQNVIDPWGTTGEVVKGAARGVAGAVSAGARSLGYKETAKAAGDIAADERLAADVSSYKDIKSPGDAARYAVGLGAESAPEMGATIGAALIGTGAAGPAGGFAAGLATSTFFNTGRNLQRQEAEQPEQDPSMTRAVAAGLAQGGLDVIVPGRIVGDFGARILGALAEKGAARVAREVGEDAVIEAVTEGAQQLIEIGQANPDLLRIIVAPKPEEVERSDQLVNELVESMVGGGVAGGTFSGGGKLLSRAAQPEPEISPDPEEEALRALPSPTGGGTIIPEVDRNEDERLYREGERIGLEIEAAKAAGASLGEVRALQAQLGEISAERARLAAEREGVAPPPAPKGPIGEALARGPAPIAPDMRSGDSIVIEPEGVSPIHGLLLGESPTGLRVRDEDGQELEIPREEIEAGTTRISPAEAVVSPEGPAVEAAPVVADESAASPVDVLDPPDEAQQAPAEAEPEIPVSEPAPAAPAPDHAAPQTIVADPAPAAQPVQGGLADAAAQAAQQTGPRLEVEPQADQLDLLQKRLAIITDQARTSGWNKRLTALRDKTEAAIAALSPAAIEPPAEEAPAAPALDTAPVNPQPAQAEEPAPAEAEQPAPKEPAAPEIIQIREKAGRLTGVDQAEADRLAAALNIKLPADGKGGFTFSWKHADRLREAVAGAPPAPAAAPAPRVGKDEPMQDYAGIDINSYDDAKSEDGRFSEIKNGFKNDAMRHHRAVAKALAGSGFTQELDRKGKPAPAVSWNAGGPAVSGDVYLRMTSPGGKTILLTTGQGSMSRKRGLTVMLQVKDGSKFLGPNELLDPSLSPSETAAQIQKIAARWDAVPADEKPAPGRRPSPPQIAPLEGMSPMGWPPAAEEIAAAAAQADPNPTDGQKEAGNYQMGHVKVHGLDISIENAKGSTRRGTAPDGKEWSVEMPAHYGYFRRTEGADGDHVDVYIGEDPDSDRAFIVDQFDPKTGKLDEHKTVLGVRSAEEALAIYDAGFSDGSGPARRRNMGPTEMSVDEFKAWLSEGDQTRPAQDTEGEKAPAPAAAPQAEPTGQDAPAAAVGEAPASPTAPTPAYGSANKLVSADRAAELRERLKAKLRDQLNAGIDPEILAIGAELAVFHIEAGARSFTTLAKAIADDLGTTPKALRKYLRAWYNGARDMLEDSDLSIEGMDDAEAVRAAIKGIEGEAADAQRRDDGGQAEAREKVAGSGSAPGADTGRDRSPDPRRDGAAAPDAARTEELEDGVQKTIPDGDAGPGASDVQPSAPERRDGSAPAGEGGGSQPDVRRDDGDRAEAPERPARTRAPSSRRADRAGDADRVPARVVEAQNYTIAPGALGEQRGWKAKARDNITAIKLLRTIEAEGRNATRQEQEALARYVGWGGLAQVFPNDADGGKIGKGFEEIGAELRELLDDAEYATARRTTQYAHFTAETVVRSMWDAARRLGFTGGKVFEPGMGTGNYPGMMPADLAAATTYHGLELDPTTARIAKLLYPKWGVRQDDFTRAPLPENAYDLVIGNPPFGDIPIKSDPKYPQGFLIHDYFFAKSLDAVRPGGLLMFVTSAGTMNKLDTKAREHLAARAELVGAVRLPGDAFEKNAGTAVTTDIIVLRKLTDAERAEHAKDPIGQPWVETLPVTLKTKDGKDKAGAASRYFVEHPEMVLGEEGFFDRLYPGRYGVRSRPGANLEGELPIALANLPADVMRSGETAQERADVDFASTERKEGSYYLTADGKLMQHRSGIGAPVERLGKGVENGKSAASIEKITAMIPVRDALRAVYAADMAGDGRNAERARKRLNAAYDAFTQRFGPINKAEFSYRRPTSVQVEAARAEAREDARLAGLSFDEGSFDPATLDTVGPEGQTIHAGTQAVARARKEAREAAEAAGQAWSEGSFDPDDMPDVVVDRRPNIDPFAEDPENYRLRAIEHYDDATGEAKKSEVFYRNVVSREVTPEIRGVDDAVLYVLNTMGRFDLGAVAAAAKMSQTEALDALGNRVFEVPDRPGVYQTSGEYLSGNVRQKLRDARAAAEKDTSFQRNVDALAAVQPEDLAPQQIAATLGMPWIPVDVVEAFAKEKLGLSSFDASYTPRFALWTVDGDNTSAAATSDFGTSRVGALELIRAILNKGTIRVVDVVKNGDGTKSEIVNKEQTEAALAKRDAILDAFMGWVYQDEARADRLAEIYNEGYNSIVVRRFDGDYLTTPGISTEWKWRPHQKRVVARIVQAGNTYMGHAVGAGKTSAMIGAGMEMRRLGLVKKPMYVVPNHMLGQFTKEFYEQYPTARIAVADERQFHTDRRKQFIADIAVADLDAVIITHSAFGKIPLSSKFLNRMTERELDEYRSVLTSIDSSDSTSRITRKKLENQIERMEQRLAKRTGKVKDQVFTFEETGVDFLFVDEAHEFRKLDFATKMGSLKGIDPDGSDMAWDLYAKTQYLETVNPGRSLVMASGTAITNTMAELYTVSRYIQPQALAEKGLEHFDAWASAFGESKATPELDAGGKYKMVTRFSRFVNLPALSSMVLQNVDVVTSRDLDQYVTRPKLKGGQRTMHLAEPSDAFRAYQSDLAARIKAIEDRKGPPKPGEDIILSVINDGRHAAIDMRLTEGGEKSTDEPSKLDLLVENVHATWAASKRQPFHGVEASGGYTAKPIDHGPATQMVFANLGLSGARGFSVVQYIRSELVRRGIPRDQIAYIADYKTHVARQRLFNDMNEGKVRILIGSVKKMGTGVNAQRRLLAIHNLDPLWFPSDDEQRNGRGLRQGNMNPEIEINDYGLKGSYDSTMWQMMERKGRFIESFWNADGSVSQMDDLGEADFYEQAKALSTADPRIIQLTEMKQDLERLQRRADAHAQEQHALKRKIAWAKSDEALAKETVERVEADIAQRVSTRGDAFSAKIGGTTFTERVKAGERLIATIEPFLSAPQHRIETIGAVGGFPIVFDMWKSGNANGRPTYSFVTAIERNGEKRSSFRVGDSALGAVRSMEATLDGFEGELDQAKTTIARAQREVESFSSRLGQPFPDKERLAALDAEVSALTKAIYEAPVVVEAAERNPIVREAEPVEVPSTIEEESPEPLASMASPIDPAAAFETTEGLYQHLRTAPRIGPFFGRLVDAGKIVLHETQASLPGEDGALSRAADGDVWRKALDRVIDGGAPGPQAIRIGRSAQVYRALGLPNVPWVIRAGKVRRIMTEHPEIDRAMLERLPDLLADPDYVFESATEGGRLVSVVGTLPDGRSVVVAIEPEGQNFDGAKAVVVTSVYGKDDLGWVETQIKRGRTLYAREGIEPGLVANFSRSDSGQRSPRGASTNTPGSRRKVVTKADLVKKSEDGAVIQGMTAPDGTIHLVAGNLTTETAVPVLLHEAFHAGVEPLVGEKVWKGLLSRLRGALAAAEARRGSGERRTGDASFWDAALARVDAAGVPPELRAEELGAYVIEAKSAAPAGLREIADRILGHVKAFVLTRFGHQIGVVTPNELRALAMGALRNGAVGTGRGPRGGARRSVAPRPTEAPSARSGAMVAPNIPALTAEQMAEMDRGVISSALTKAMEGGAGGKISILGLVPGRPLFAELSKKMTGAQEYLSLKTEMDALRNERHAQTDKTAQAWRKLIGKDGAANAKLMDIMHEATLLGADPSKPYQSTLSDRDRLVLSLPSRGQAYQIAAAAQAKDASRQAEWAKLRKRLRALPAEFQAMFETVRDEYAALNTAFDEAIIENAGRAIDAAIRKAERAHEEEMGRIRDEGLAGKERAAAVAEADRKLASTKYRVRANRRARMADLRAEFETAKIAAPYFPLARFGSFFVTTRDAETGQVLGFSTFESPKAQQAFVKEQAANPAHKVEAGALGETSVRHMVDPGFVQAVEKILIDANMPEAILDAVWQQWLQTMPDLSLRKKRIHRKGTPGFSSDAFRAFGHHMFHGAHQLARLRYAIALDEALEIAGAQAKAQPDPVRAGLIVEEMKRRHEFTMNPKGAWWSQAVTSAAFIWHLAMSPAAAIVNLSQTSIMGPPILGAAFPEAGVRGAARELVRALHDFSRGLATWRPGQPAEDSGTVGASGRLSTDEQAAMEEAYRRGTVDKSQAHDLAGVGETGVEYSATRARIMGVVSWAFHHTERLNREVTFLAAYRMARKSGLEHHDAIDRASDVTWRTHFDYQGSSRPRVMQGDAAKVLLVFRNFQVNMLYRLVRDVHQSINAKDKAERKEALTQLAGITGMLFLNGGIRGVWGFGLAMSIIGMFFAGGSDDSEDELKKAVIGALGVELGGMVLNGIPGHLTGTDLTSRVGMPDLWFRSSDRIVEGEDAYNYWLGEFLGAGFGMAERAFRGSDLLMKGEFQRGIETLLPKGLRDLARASRFAMEGVTTMKGDELVPDVSAGEVLRQALGFTPARVAERFDANSKMKNAETRIMDERQGLMTEVAAAAKDGGALSQRLIGRIEAFNRAHPTYPITMDSLRTSLRSRARSSARMEFGILLNPRLNDEIRGRAAPLVYE